MKRTKAQKGITLIALIITIVVLLILATVAISSITNDGILDKAQDAASTYEIAQEKEKLQMAALERFLTNSTGNLTLENQLASIYGEENVQLNADNSVTVTTESGNKYIVTEDGNATLLDGSVQEPEAAIISVSLDKTEITKEINHGETATESITATLNNASGTLTWLSSDTDVAEIVTTEGNTRTIEIKKAGTATITVKYAENTSIGAVCTINVIEKTGHSYTETGRVAATCTTTGTVTYTCGACGDTYNETLEKLSHTVVTDAAVAATCTTSGLTAGSHCSVCNTVLTAQQTVPATGHQNTTIINASAGYTGDTYCNDCKTTIATGEAITATLTITGSFCQGSLRINGTDYKSGDTLELPVGSVISIETYETNRCNSCYQDGRFRFYVNDTIIKESEEYFSGSYEVVGNASIQGNLYPSTCRCYNYVYDYDIKIIEE